MDGRDWPVAQTAQRWDAARRRSFTDDTRRTVVADVSWLAAQLDSQLEGNGGLARVADLDAQRLADVFDGGRDDAATWARRLCSTALLVDWLESRGWVDPRLLRRVRSDTHVRDRQVVLLVDEFISAMQGKSERTRQAYREDLLGIADLAAATSGGSLPEVTVSQLDVRTLDQAFAGWAQRRPSPNSLARAHAAWSSWFSWLVARELADRSPMPAIDKPKTPPSTPRRLRADDPGTDVVEAIVAAASVEDPRARPGNRWPARDLAAMCLLLFCGLRRAEAVALDVGMLLRGRDEISRLSFVGKGGKPRTVPLPHEIVATVDEYLADRVVRFDLADGLGRADPLLVDRDNTRMTARQLAYLVERVLDRAQVRQPEGSLVHAFRHTYAFQLLESGVPVNQLRELLGHSSLATTQRYVQASGDELYDAQRLHSGLGALRQARDDATGGTDPGT